ncbi:MAG TPA: glycosyltransferase family 4 protein, partial [Kiritimatiellia bacterium]|nr:glycosyltransferase family 4 protein [Kiritimatiellia bacterium]
IHRFIAVSDEVAELLRQAVPHRAGDILTKACAVEVPAHLNRNYSGSDESLQIVYAGRITNHEKRVYKLLPLAEALRKRGVDFHLRIIGDGGFRWGLNKAVRELTPSLQKCIVIEGPRSPADMASVWEAADVCVLVSDREGTAVSMLEAMAHGCVPVVTRVSGTAAVIDHGINGFVSDIDDLEAMAGHIARLAADRTVLAECGRKGPEKISADYSLKDYLEWFQSLVDGVWSNPPRKWPVAKPLIMPNAADMRPGLWTRLKRELCAKRDS